LKDKADSINHEAVKDSISQFLILFPYYKLYSNFYPLSEEDSNLIIAVVKTAIARNPSLIDPLNLLQLTLLNQNPVGDDSRALNFFMRVMQYTGSLMAKGIEDTAMYDYNCFIAHNEVGDSIHASGLSLSEFHQAMIHRQNMTPLSINTTSTHDTKRGEDVRARLNVISELAGKWIKNVNNWKELNKPLKSLIGDREVPDINEEYFIYKLNYKRKYTEIEFQYLKIIFGISILIFLISIHSFYEFSYFLFNKSVDFLNWFYPDFNYIESSVIFCIVIPSIIYLLLISIKIH